MPFILFSIYPFSFLCANPWRLCPEFSSSFDYITPARILFPSNENLRLYLFYSKAHGLQTANRPIIISHTAAWDGEGVQEDKVACVPYFLWARYNIKLREKPWQYLYHHSLIWFALDRDSGCKIGTCTSLNFFPRSIEGVTFVVFYFPLRISVDFAD
jgi:hypothetical protein